MTEDLPVQEGRGHTAAPFPTVRPAAAKLIADLLDHGRGLDLVERSVGEAEVGTSVHAAAGTVIAVIRGNEVLAPDDPRAGRLEHGDQLILVSSRDRTA
jgi:voltage-gated potassium channel